MRRAHRGLWYIVDFYPAIRARAYIYNRLNWIRKKRRLNDTKQVKQACKYIADSFLHRNYLAHIGDRFPVTQSGRGQLHFNLIF